MVNNIYKLNEDEDVISNEDDTLKNDLDNPETATTPDSNMSQDEFIEKWNKVKSNNASILKEFNALQRDKRLGIYASKNSALNKTLRVVGMSLVGLSTLIGRAFKLINFLIPGADIATGFVSPFIAPFRVAGQAMVNANSKVNIPKRVTPSTRTDSNR